MKMDVAKVFAGDAFSKVILLVLHVVLIKYMAISNYAELTLMLNGILLGYQLACAPLERIYISSDGRGGVDFAKLKYIFSFLSVFFICFWLYEKINLHDNFIVAVGIIILSNQQFVRVVAQKKMRFTIFSIVEIVKNFMWFLWVIFLFFIIKVYKSEFVILGLILSSFFVFIFYRISYGNEYVVGANHPWVQSIKDLYSVRFVILYSSITSLVPYLPIFFISNNIDLLSTYGAAMRYLAILSMAVYAFNVVFLPKLSLLSVSDRVEKVNSFKRRIPLLSLYYLIFVIIACIMVSFLNDNKYTNLVSIFSILSLTSFFSLLTVPFINLLLVFGREKYITFIVFFSFVFSVICYFCLNTISIVYSPAISLSICYFCVFLLCFFRANMVVKNG